MNRALLLRDQLALPRNHDVYRGAHDPNPRGGCVEVFDAQKREDTLARTEMFMAPVKLNRFKGLDVDRDVNVCGMPDQLVFDNGVEVKASRIQSLEKLGVTVKHCKAITGREKPFIERLNRSLKETLEWEGK
jgi:putative transposase